MKIYYNKVHIETIKNLIRAKEGDYFLRLVGVNYSQDPTGKIHVEPVYQPALSVQNNAGQVTVDFYLKNGLVRFILQKRTPRISVGHYTLSLEDDE